MDKWTDIIKLWFTKHFRDLEAYGTPNSPLLIFYLHPVVVLAKSGPEYLNLKLKHVLNFKSTIVYWFVCLFFKVYKTL